MVIPSCYPSSHPKSPCKWWSTFCHCSLHFLEFYVNKIRVDYHTPLSFFPCHSAWFCLFVCLFFWDDPWRREWQPTPVFLPGESQGRGSLVGGRLWGHEESDTTERLHFHFSLSCIGEGNGNLLQCSCLENPRDGGVWWAAIYGVTRSLTWLKRLSSSSSML